MFRTPDERCSSSLAVGFAVAISQTMQSDTSIMPPPPVPSRKRQKMSSSGSSVGSDANSFSERVKGETRRFAGDECWNCGATPTQTCHVFAIGDHLLASLLSSRGLLGFDLSSTDNAIALCPTCHANFDNSSDPGFVFVPADLDYFVQFEKNDYARRTRDGTNGILSERICPNPLEYQRHCQTAADSPDLSSGGLYRRVFLQSYLRHGAQELANTLKAWHGNPMAAIRRGILATGTMRLDRFPGSVLDRLRELQDLYSRPDPTVYGTDSPVVPTAEIDPIHGNAAAAYTQSQSVPGHSADARARTDDTYRTAQGTGADSGSPAWTLGPNLSTQDVVERYRNVLTNAAI